MRRQQGLLRPLVPLRDHVSFDRSTQDHSEKPDHSAKYEISFEVSSVHGNSPLRKRCLRGTMCWVGGRHSGYDPYAWRTPTVGLANLSIQLPQPKTRESRRGRLMPADVLW